jgi:hypothetical protein
MTDTYVNVYAMSRCYGGPEEGGWYYDAGVPVTSVRVEFTDDERDDLHQVIVAALGEDPDFVNGLRYEKAWKRAVQFQADRIAEHLRERFPETGKASDVLGGEDYRVVIEDHYGKHWSNYEPWE